MHSTNYIFQNLAEYSIIQTAPNNYLSHLVWLGNEQEFLRLREVVLKYWYFLGIQLLSTTIMFIKYCIFGLTAESM